MYLKIEKDQVTFGLSFAVILLLWSYFFVGLKTDHILFALIIGLGACIHRVVFKVILGFLAFLVFLIIYDSLQVYPNYEVNPISTIELYNFEKLYFGLEYQGERITACEYFLKNQVPVLSFFLGFSYLMWMPAPFLFSAYLYLKDKDLLMRYSFAFLFVNLLGFIGYYLYPAAPPWYYFKYGTELFTDINGDAGLLVNFDKIVGFPVFENIYNRSANVFCAIPSLHCAFMVINVFYAFKTKNRFIITSFILLAIGTWVAAVYSQHHYIVDVVLGLITALLTILLYEKLNFRRMFKPLISWILNRIR